MAREGDRATRQLRRTVARGGDGTGRVAALVDVFLVKGRSPSKRHHPLGLQRQHDLGKDRDFGGVVLNAGLCGDIGTGRGQNGKGKTVGHGDLQKKESRSKLS